jgi:hypothetical protein
MNTKHFNTRTVGTLAAMALAAPALAQSAPAGRFSQPLAGGAPQDGWTVVRPQQNSAVETRVMMTKTDGADTYEVAIVGDKATAKVNGKDVPQDRIRRSDGKIEILGEDGSVLTTFDVASVHGDAGGMTRIWAGPGGALAIGGQGGAMGIGGAQGGPAPKVMLGVTMVEPSESLVENLGLEPGTGIQLGSVMEGLPADKAGLKKSDVIVSFDGVKPITVAKAREILAKKKEGDRVEVVVLRKGDEKTITVHLEKFDPAKFAPGVRMGQGERAAMDPDADAHQRMREQMESALREGRAFQWNATPGPDGNAFVFGPRGEKFDVFASPGSPELKERMAALDKKLSELDEKMTKLDEQLGRLQKALDKLNSH